MVLTARKFYSDNYHPNGKQEADFFQRILLSNGTYKMTSDRRLDDLNRLTISVWRSLNVKPAALQDVGVSSGISTKEWLEALEDSGFSVNITATDIFINAKLLRFPLGMDVLVDQSGAPLQYGLAGVSVSPTWGYGSLLTRLGSLSIILNAVYANLRSRNRRAGTVEDIQLISPRVRGNPRIEFLEDDITKDNSSEMTGVFDAVRAANILNRSYFPEDILRKAVGNLKGRLKGAGSFLIVNRTHRDTANHGTIFGLNDANKFEILGRVGDGSEIEDLVLAS